MEDIERGDNAVEEIAEEQEEEEEEEEEEDDEEEERTQEQERTLMQAEEVERRRVEEAVKPRPHKVVAHYICIQGPSPSCSLRLRVKPVDPSAAHPTMCP